jgi:hypothetical protein
MGLALKHIARNGRGCFSHTQAPSGRFVVAASIPADKARGRRGIFLVFRE